MKKPESRAAWLYKHNQVIWMNPPEIRRQLPFLFRIFAVFCSLQNHQDPQSEIRYGELVMDAIIRLTKLLRLKDTTVINLPEYSIYLDLLDPRFLHVVNEFDPHSWVRNTLQHLVHEGDTFIDVGANHGSFSIIASKLVGSNGRVISIEPQPRLSKLVERSLGLNADCSYEVFQLACGDHEGSIDFYMSDNTSGIAGIYKDYSASGRSRKIQVPMMRLDDVVDFNVLDRKVTIKLDVEGSEYAVLYGAGNLIRMFAPILLLEINPQSLRAANVPQDRLISLLIDYGYDTYAEVETHSEITSISALDTSYDHNIIAYPKLIH